MNTDTFFSSHRLPIATAAIAAGHDVHLACATSGLEPNLTKLGIHVHSLSLSRSGTSPTGELRTALQVLAVVGKVRPDIVHCVTIKPVLYGSIAARLQRVPVRVASISGLGYVFIAQGIKASLLRAAIRLAYRHALKGAKVVIFQNTADRDVLREMNAVSPSQEVLIRGSGVDLEAFRPTEEPTDSPVAMLVARLLVDKGVNEFVDAARRLAETHPTLRMVLVGDADPGNPKSVTPDRVAAWVEEGLVEHWGFTHDVSATMAMSNVIVLPSYREGLPKTLIEAAACGRAVVTTDVPGCRDAIEPGESGLLVPARSGTELARAIARLIDDPTLRHEFARRGRLLAEKAFDIDGVVARHLSIYADADCSAESSSTAAG